MTTSLDRIEKVTEFILVAFARQINKSPEEIANLLTEDPKYISNLIVCGIEDRHDFVISFLEQVYVFNEKLVQMALTDVSHKTLTLLLNFLKSGLVSRSGEVCK